MIPYTKLNSQGNDFILVEQKDLSAPLTNAQIKHYSNRNKIGCDQFFIIDTERLDKIYCHVFNQDGTKACQCGNGLRASMLYLHKKYKLSKTDFIVCDKPYNAEIKNETISVTMGVPSYIDNTEDIDQKKYSVKKDGIIINLKCLEEDLGFSYIPLSIGNDHCVVLSRNCFAHKDQICKIINELYHSTMNIGFIENAADFLNDSELAINLIVNEKGAGYTDSCGSGATAAAICLFKLYELNNETKVHNSKIKVNQKGGTLEVDKRYDPDVFILTGPSSFDGEGFLD